jgi:hypothetical protein
MVKLYLQLIRMYSKNSKESISSYSFAYVLITKRDLRSSDVELFAMFSFIEKILELESSKTKSCFYSYNFLRALSHYLSVSHTKPIKRINFSIGSKIL